MIQEHAKIFVHSDQCDAFEKIFPEAILCISGCKGYIRHELHNGIENSDTDLLIIDWETLEDHVIGFRESENFQKWRSYVQPFFSRPPEASHVQLLFSSERYRITPKPVTLLGK